MLSTAGDCSPGRNEEVRSKKEEHEEGRKEKLDE
jgi:hypothetical protein